MTYWRKLTETSETLYRNNFGNPRSALARAAAALASVQNRIGRISSEMEQRFMRSAALLDTLTDNSSVLVTDSERLVALATGQQGGEGMISETVAVVEGPLEFLQRWQASMDAHIEALHEAGAIVVSLRDIELTLGRLFLPLRHAQTMFRVEASHLSDEARTVFATLTDEIGSVQEQVGEGFREQFRILARTQEILEQVTRIISAESARAAVLVAAKQEQIATSLAKLTDEMNRNSGRQVQFSATSASVSEQVMSLVMALQTHDIVTQRLANIRTGLGKAENIILAVPRGEERRNIVKAAYQTSDLLKLQSAQIKATAARMEQADLDVQGAVGTILASIDAIGEECLQLREFTEVTVSADGTIQILLDMIDDVRQLTVSGIEVAQKARTLVEPIAGLANALTGTVQRLASEMLHIALNAQLRAVQIGSGTGLEVLAAHTAEVSRHTSLAAGNISEKMTRLTSRLTEMSTQLEELSIDGESNLNLLATNGVAQERKLHSLRDEMLNQLIAVCNRADTIGQAAKAVGDAVAGQDWALLPLRGSIDTIDALESSIVAASPGRSSECQVETDHHLSYTMSAERETHLSVLGGHEPSQEPNQEESLVELF